MSTCLDRILDIAERHLPEAGVDCLLIGGFAVNHYGYTRHTLDVDFMILSEKVAAVRRVMLAEGFTNIEVHENVVFFSAPTGGPRVDFLRVAPSTMTQLLAGATWTSVHGRALRVPSLKDLLAMKLFALSQNTARRMGKDLPDIAYLSVINHLDIEADLRPLCDRFGSPETFRLVREQIEGLGAP